VAAMIRYIVLEKELRQKELMKMMSVKESDIGWSWFIFFFVFHAVTSAGAALVSTLLYEESSSLLLFIFWEFAFLAIICFSFFLASLFSQATRATLVSLLIFFVGYFLTLIVNYQTKPVGVIFLIALHPIGAFAFGLQEIGRLEDLGVGLSFSTMTQTDSPNGYTFANSKYRFLITRVSITLRYSLFPTLLRVPVALAMSSFLFDALFWGIMSWYMNRVARAEYGRPLPWYFPFTSSYWCPRTARAPTEDEEEMQYPLDVPVEPVTTAMKEQIAQGKGIEIRKLTKAFGDKTAVDQLSINIFSNQITALLGHNGAGSWLIGCFYPAVGHI
jgi:ATP-binding cassette, subfamily A (ABC1), member 3